MTKIGGAAKYTLHAPEMKPIAMAVRGKIPLITPVTNPFMPSTDTQTDATSAFLEDMEISGSETEDEDEQMLDDDASAMANSNKSNANQGANNGKGKGNNPNPSAHHTSGNGPPPDQTPGGDDDDDDEDDDQDEEMDEDEEEYVRVSPTLHTYYDTYNLLAPGGWEPTDFVNHGELYAGDPSSTFVSEQPLVGAVLLRPHMPCPGISPYYVRPTRGKARIELLLHFANNAQCIRIPTANDTAYNKIEALDEGTLVKFHGFTFYEKTTGCLTVQILEILDTLVVPEMIQEMRRLGKIRIAAEHPDYPPYTETFFGNASALCSNADMALYAANMTPQRDTSYVAAQGSAGLFTFGALTRALQQAMLNLDDEVDVVSIDTSNVVLFFQNDPQDRDGDLILAHDGVTNYATMIRRRRRGCSRRSRAS